MPFETPQHSRSKVSAAGKTLIQAGPAIQQLEEQMGSSLVDPEAYEAMLFELRELAMQYEGAQRIMNNWRSSHQYPLQIIYMTLRNRAKAVDSTSIVSSRLKRLSSIERKLELNPQMMLARIQDIGGCRAVVQTVKHVDKLVRQYEERKSGTTIYVNCSDYIKTPKPTGYRGIHLIYKYHSNVLPQSECNDLRIEIQIRSRLQHAWATAIETVDTFTEQALKSNIGDDDWKRFFCLMGSALAIKEGCPLVPDTPENPAELKAEITKLSEQLQVERVLTGWRVAVEHITLQKKKGMKARFFLLILDLTKSVVTVRPYSEAQALEAQDAYAKIEKDTAGDPNVQAVLVSVNSVQALPIAYPNYYLDTQGFIKEVNEAIA